MLVFRLVALGFCAACAVWFGVLFQRSYWPTTTATVKQSRVARVGQGQLAAQLDVHYDWLGKPHDAQLRALTTGSLALAETEVQAHPVGSNILVCVHPDHPEAVYWPPFTSSASWGPPLILLFSAFLFWAVPEGVMLMVDRRVDVAKAAGFMCLGVGLLFAGLGAGLGLHKARLLQEWPEAQAEIVHAEVIPVGRGLSAVRLHCRFTTATGTHQGTAVSGYRSLSPDLARYPVGSNIPIRYWPKQPDLFVWGAGWRFGYFLESLIFTGLGIVLVGLGLVFRRLSK